MTGAYLVMDYTNLTCILCRHLQVILITNAFHRDISVDFFIYGLVVCMIWLYVRYIVCNVILVASRSS